MPATFSLRCQAGRFIPTAYGGRVEGNGLRERVHDQMSRVWAELAELVSLRSVADARRSGECAKAARWVLDAFVDAGLPEVRLEPTADGGQAVYGHRAGPAGTPTVLLHAHYDVRSPLDEAAWLSPPFELTERDGRWYGRGAADGKGNILMHLTALRALGDKLPVSVKLIVDGAGERGSGGLAAFVAANPEQLRADAIVVCEAGNVAVGVPGVTTSLRGMANVVVTVSALVRPVPSGRYGGPTPDALAALIQMLATLRDSKGNTTVRGLYSGQKWTGVAYHEQRLRHDAQVLDGVDLLGDGTVADMVWARPAVTVLGIDVPAVPGSTGAIQPTARARINLRVPPGMDPVRAQDALVHHLETVAPWGVRVGCDREPPGAPFRARTDGPAYSALSEAMHEAYGKQLSTEGQGGSIPLCNALAGAYPDAEIILIGVQEPLSLTHAANESVDPSEIEHMALSQALFLQRYAMADAP